VQAKAKGITVTHHCIGCNQAVWADPGRLLQVVSNLVNNAIKFTPEGGTVDVSAYGLDSDELPVRIGGQRTQSIRISVSDTGPGMSQEQLALLFQPFNQIATTSKQTVGTGLGLSITKRLSELLGGRVSVSSVLGEGSVFSLDITLPLVSTQVTVSASSSVSPAHVTVHASSSPRTASHTRIVDLDDDAPGVTLRTSRCRHITHAVVLDDVMVGSCSHCYTILYVHLLLFFFPRCSPTACY
jgi:hypothetical protein